MTLEELEQMLAALVPGGDQRERRGRPPMIASRAVLVDRAVWLAKRELGSLGKARKAVSKQHRLTFDHVRKLGRIALQVRLHEIAETAMEEVWMAEPQEMLIAAE